MRIGFVIYGDLQQCTGGYIYDRYLISHLRGAGHEIELISLPDRVIPKISCNLSFSLIRKIRDLELDILIQDALCLPSLIGLNQILNHYCSFPKIALIHQLIFLRQNQQLRKSFYYFLEKTYLETTEAIIVNSESLQNCISRDLEVNRANLVARPGGDRLGGICSRKEIEDKCYRDGPLNLFFLGNILPDKGLHSLINALRDLDPEIWNLRVAGDLDLNRPYSRYLKKIIAESGLSSNIKLLGLLERQALKKEMLKNHLLVMPFSIEGFGIAYLEGMSFGLPAIGSNQGAAGEIIVHGKNGFLIDPTDEGTLREYLSFLNLHRDKLKEMSMAAFDSFSNSSTWESNMEKIRLFLEVMTGNFSIESKDK